MLNRLKRRKAPIKQIGVNYRICHFCGACVGACPANALLLQHSHLVIETTCTHCERCVPVCPVGALFFVDLSAKAAA